MASRRRPRASTSWRRYLLATEGVGRFDFVAAGNWNDTEVEKVPSTNVIDNICNGQPPGCTPPVLFARINTLAFEEGTPDSKISLGIDWALLAGGVDLGVNLKGTRYGKSSSPACRPPAEINAGIPDARDLHIQPDWVVDLGSRPKLLDDKLGLALGADNLFDQYPDRVPNARALPNPPGGTVNLNATNALGYLALFAVRLQRALPVRAHVVSLVDASMGPSSTGGPI